MILLLYGEDTFRSLQKLKEIISYYKDLNKTGLNLKFFDFENNSFEDFKDQFQTKSIFDEKKFFILKNTFLNNKLKDKFKKQQKHFLKSKNIIVLYEKKDIKSKDPFLISLKGKAKSQKFELLNNKEVENWIKKESKKMNLEIQKKAIDALIERAGNNLWQLSNELKKLANYKWNKNKIEIKKEDVEKIVHQKAEPNIFKTINFIAEKEKEKALLLLKEHLKKGDSPLYLLTMINFQFRNLLIIKEIYKSGKNIYLKTKKSQIHPFVVKKSLPLCKKFNIKELKEIYRKIYQTDINIKTGKISPELGLDLLIAQT